MSCEPSSGCTNVAFTVFSLLPKELRLEIWKRALPEPRLIEMTFIDREWPLRRLLTRRDQPGAWVWVATTNDISLPLLRVNAEARSLTLGSYTLVQICTQTHSIGQQIYIDFYRDTIYFARYSQERLFDVLDGRFAEIQHTGMLTSKARSLAINLGSLSKGPWNWDPDTYPGVEHLSSAEGRTDASKLFVKMFRSFPKLRELFVVVDGRHPDLGGSVEIARPSSDQEDFYEPAGQDIAKRWIPEALNKVREISPDLHQPRVALAVLTNGSNSAILERRWDYLHACCRFREPGADGHRSESESVSSDGSGAAIAIPDSEILAEDTVAPK
ncbi:hypothetical protein IFR04_004624 [Cadophora malorum]|uniref:2EXR domain-containing protein n=1 Tax=Cadophora malorum TaxID=108018 RepID=A0A8H8BSA6_9HELO|nr:hypothetical protein IFR04_004624 [Cadophora malorum]